MQTPYYPQGQPIYYQQPVLQPQSQQLPPQDPFIPTEAFLYFPTDQDDLFFMSGGLRYRRVLEGNILYDHNEKYMLAELQATLDSRGVNLNDPVWTQGYLMRFLQAKKFVLTEAVDCIKEHALWRRATLPIQMTQQIQNLLNTGAIYFSGRDAKYRPLMYINVDKILKLNLGAEELKGLVAFLITFAIDNLLLPGQVENWVVITDLEGAGLFSLPYGILKEVFSFMQNNFRGRLYRAYVLNAPWTFSAVWSTVKAFMEESTASKIVISTDPSDSTIFTHVNKAQLEARYGGLLPDKVSDYWPIRNLSNRYQLDERPTALIPPQEYRRLRDTGALHGCRINHTLG